MKKTKRSESDKKLRTRIYSAMYRCNNPKNPRYRTYKGKWGLGTPEEAFDYLLPLWKKAEKKYPNHNSGKRADALSIDRINNRAGYRKGNVEFVPLSVNVKRKKHTKATRKRISKAKKGKKHSEETKQKIRLSVLKRMNGGKIPPGVDKEWYGIK